MEIAAAVIGGLKWLLAKTAGLVWTRATTHRETIFCEIDEFNATYDVREADWRTPDDPTRLFLDIDATVQFYLNDTQPGALSDFWITFDKKGSIGGIGTVPKQLAISVLGSDELPAKRFTLQPKTYTSMHIKDSIVRGGQEGIESSTHRRHDRMWLCATFDHKITVKWLLATRFADKSSNWSAWNYGAQKHVREPYSARVVKHDR
jgi:hypothetical protein